VADVFSTEEDHSVDVTMSGTTDASAC